MNSKFPKRISQIIQTGRARGYTAKTIRDRVNGSATAKKLRQKYTTRQVAAHMAWFTIRENR